MPTKLTHADFLRKSLDVHGDRYDYSESIYSNNNTKINVICKQHGKFAQRASNHMLGIGCPMCKAELTSKRCIDDLSSFLAKAKAVHGDAYDYSLVEYTKSNQKVQIKCAIHGSFLQKPNGHISRKSGCPKCAGKTMTTDEFVGKARVIHGDVYGYENTEYKLIKEPVIVTCKIHGDFNQSAEAHLIGHGCRQCVAESFSSAGEIEVGDFVESLGFQVQRNTRLELGNRLEIDVFIPSKKVAIEYNGYYWHSDKVEKNKRKHEFKHACADLNGLRMITVWDYDWLNRPSIVKRHIAHALGASVDPRINARSCAITSITTNEANALYEENHLQGACRGGVLHIGLQFCGKLVAAMTFSKGSARRGIISEGEWELSRYSTTCIVRGGASRLFAEFVRSMHPVLIWSFSDKQHFDGAIYKKLGFNMDGELPSDYRLIHPNKMRTWHKSLWQRKSIQKRLIELGSSETFDHATDPRTEHQMHDVAKVLRIWDAGKIRWKWSV